MGLIGDYKQYSRYPVHIVLILGNFSDFPIKESLNDFLQISWKICWYFFPSNSYQIWNYELHSSNWHDNQQGVKKHPLFYVNQILHLLPKLELIWLKFEIAQALKTSWHVDHYGITVFSIQSTKCPRGSIWP